MGIPLFRHIVHAGFRLRKLPAVIFNMRLRFQQRLLLGFKQTHQCIQVVDRHFDVALPHLLFQGKVFLGVGAFLLEPADPGFEFMDDVVDAAEVCRRVFETLLRFLLAQLVLHHSCCLFDEPAPLFGLRLQNFIHFPLGNDVVGRSGRGRNRGRVH